MEFITMNIYIKVKYCRCTRILSPQASPPSVCSWIRIRPRGQRRGRRVRGRLGVRRRGGCGWRGRGSRDGGERRGGEMRQLCPRSSPRGWLVSKARRRWGEAGGGTWDLPRLHRRHRPCVTGIMRPSKSRHHRLPEASDCFLGALYQQGCHSRTTKPSGMIIQHVLYFGL
ncbi:hypothetical protein GUJ93_ZPchr0005g14596 [Zizania palustris]|uniref:Uncharacterized protein n=1 Tax=Zizania palustris TaxID=103762 RepID=A0A8J5SNK7_ZIZPA|nr:hypothetical protein GUJ93_ZPchr0005g14596 [Zizania palustris]